MNIKSNREVSHIFENYPENVKVQMQRLRAIVQQSANELDGIEELEETLKWGEPSYLTKYGSTVRIDWKDKKPDQYAVYFKCTSKLVETFKHIYANDFEYEGTRAIVFKLEDKIPEEKLKHCLKTALQYHKVKKQPWLGMLSKK